MSPGTSLRSRNEPLHALLITAVAILGGDIVVMFILPLMKFLPPMVLPYIDGILLTVVATPFLYFLLYRPLVHTIEEQQRAEDALSTLNAQLEGRIAERTKELEDAVTVLQKEVAARREVEARLVKTNQFTQRLIECAPCLMAVIDVKDMRCSYVNGRISDLLGFEPEAATLAGSSFLEMIASPADHSKLVRFVKTVADGRPDETISAKIDLRNSDGRPSSFRLALSAVSRAEREAADEVLLTAVPLLTTNWD